MPVYVMWIVAGPGASGFSTDSTTISFSFSGVTLAFCVAPPLVMVTSWKSMSTAFSVISEVGFSTPDGDRFVALESGLLEIGREGQFVILRSGHLGQTLRGSQRECQHEKGRYCENSLHCFPLRRLHRIVSKFCFKRAGSAPHTVRQCTPTRYGWRLAKVQLRAVATPFRTVMAQ